MHLTAVYRVVITIVAVLQATSQAVDPTKTQYNPKKSRCLNPPRTARRVESFIQQCQDEVKNKLINEAYQMMKDEMHQLHAQHASTMAPADVATAESAPGSAMVDEFSPTAIDFALQDELDAQTSYATDYEQNAPRRHAERMVEHIRRMGHVPLSASTVYHPTLVPYEDKRIAGCLLHCVYAKNNAIDTLGWPTLDGLVHFYSEGVNEHGFFMATLRSVNLCLRAVTLKYRVNRRKLPERGESCDLAFDVFDCISDQITGYCLDQYK